MAVPCLLLPLFQQCTRVPGDNNLYSLPFDIIGNEFPEFRDVVRIDGCHVFYPDGVKEFFVAFSCRHIPNKGEHQIRYYGWYSNKRRGMRKAPQADSSTFGPDEYWEKLESDTAFFNSLAS